MQRNNNQHKLYSDMNKNREERNKKQTNKQKQPTQESTGFEKSTIHKIFSPINFVKPSTRYWVAIKQFYLT